MYVCVCVYIYIYIYIYVYETDFLIRGVTAVTGVGRARDNPLWNFMVRQLNQKKMRAPLWKKCSFKCFVKKTLEKRTFLPQRRFSFVLLIICDNLIFIVFFNIKPSNTKK